MNKEKFVDFFQKVSYHDLSTKNILFKEKYIRYFYPIMNLVFFFINLKYYSFNSQNLC